MKTKAVRLYGKNDLRLEEFELPEIKDDEILAQVVSDSACMSSYKAVSMGAEHKRVPDNVAENPVIIGHEFCGKIIKVGKKWQNDFREGDKFSIQPAMNYRGTLDAPGYSFSYIGGDSQYVVIPHMVMETGCLLKYTGDGYYFGSLAEPVSCIIGAFHANYHVKQGSYVHKMGIVPGGRVAILAGVGPMGLSAIEYALNGPVKPSLVVVTGGYTGNPSKLLRAQSIYTEENAAEKGITLKYVDMGRSDAPVKELLDLTDGEGYTDVFCMSSSENVIEQADDILSKDGCLNFFAGPAKTDFKAPFNFFNVHYNGSHIVGTSGGNNDDLTEALSLMSAGVLDPSCMVTHIGGLNAVIDTVLNLPKIPGGKKMIYTHIDFPLTALSDLAKLGESDPLCARLAEIVKNNNGLWNTEAENYLLENAPKI